VTEEILKVNVSDKVKSDTSFKVQHRKYRNCTVQYRKYRNCTKSVIIMIVCNSMKESLLPFYTHACVFNNYVHDFWSHRKDKFLVPLKKKYLKKTKKIIKGACLKVYVSLLGGKFIFLL